MDTVRERGHLADFLPLYYRLLDPARIPTGAELDASSADIIRANDIAVDMAMLSLEAIFAIQPPLQTGADLWLRLFAWVQFVQMFRDLLSAGFKADIPSEEALLLGFVTFSRDICEHGQNKLMITSTAGFKSIAVRAWRCLVNNQDISLLEDALYNSLPFIAIAPSLAHEIIDGAGGTIDDLATLVVRHFDLVLVEGPDTPLSRPRLGLIHYALEIWAHVDGMGVYLQGARESPQRLTLALIARGIVRPLTRVFCLVSSSADPDSARVIEQCLILLGALFLTRDGYRVLRFALQSGLLHALLCSSQRVLSANAFQGLGFLLADILAPATVYYYVLSDLWTAYSEVADNIDRDSFTDPQIGVAWGIVERTTLHRHDVLRSFESEDHVCRRACDNVQCGIIKEKTRFWRCSGCFALFYCSKECQRLDWRRGHRAFCSFYRSGHTDIHLNYTSRERAFIRALLYHDFKENKFQIYRESAATWVTKPNAELVVFFDYNFADVVISVRELSESGLTGPRPAHHWPDMIARASTSDGRMSLNGVILPEAAGIQDRCRVIPLHTPTPAVYDRLKRIAAGMRAPDRVPIHELVRLVNPDPMSQFH
ncbi:hypothetical protein DFH07DRAFT_834222 [Mycena maculata]|uniref:MYND-type domain-containing protein n=1 Tax=Mycena maculata TaxID=230809 RepID=A0AAD7IJP2_9AGAR|nr:hypothetical protein DFH07DRAFT_834222 [Mycena maculata]